MTDRPRPRPRELRRLTSLRWYAALLVFLFHLPDPGIGWAPVRQFDLGYTGVSFFFVLSGFVLVWSRGDALAPSEFYVRRFARIYPAMAVMTVLVAVLLVFDTGLDQPTGWLGLITSLLVIQAWFPGNYPVFSVNSVSWSLSVEAFFYAMFPWVVAPLARLSPRRQIAIAAAWLAAGAAATVLLAHDEYTANIAYSNPLIRSGEFLAGIVLALRMRAGWRVRVPVWVAGLVTVAAYELGRHGNSWAHFPTPNFIMVLPFVLLVAAAAQADIDGRVSFLTRSWSVYLGRVSFCFYLTHLFVSLVVGQAFGWRHTWSLAGGVLPVAVLFAASLGAAVALHEGVEKPLERLVRARWHARRRPREAVPQVT